MKTNIAYTLKCGSDNDSVEIRPRASCMHLEVRRAASGYGPGETPETSLTATISYEEIAEFLVEVFDQNPDAIDRVKNQIAHRKMQNSLQQRHRHQTE